MLHPKLCQHRQHKTSPAQLQPERVEKFVLDLKSHTVPNTLYGKQCTVSSTLSCDSLFAFLLHRKVMKINYMKFKDRQHSRDRANRKCYLGLPTVTVETSNYGRGICLCRTAGTNG